MDCIAVINQKGGVGKTATSVNLGVALAQRGLRMLLIDLDPQAHLTTHLGLDTQAQGKGAYEVLTQGLSLESAIHPYAPNVSVLPAHIDLAAAEVELLNVVGREVILRDLLAERDWPFDAAVIDCPPSLNVLTLNALGAAHHVLIPVQPHFLALQGVGKLLETVQLVTRRINPQLRVAGAVMTLFESGTRLSGEVFDDLAAFLASARGTKVPWAEAEIFQTQIRRNVKLAECPSYGQSIFEYAPSSKGAMDYLALADELMIKLLRPPAPAAAGIEAPDPTALDRTPISSPRPAVAQSDSAPLRSAESPAVAAS